MKYAFEVGLPVVANVIVYHASLRFMESNIKKGGGWLNGLFSRYCAGNYRAWDTLRRGV